MLACKVELSETAIPFIHNEHPGDEVFGLLRRICKLWLIKVPLGGQNVVEGLVVIITKEWRQTAQANRTRLFCFFKQFSLRSSACIKVLAYSMYVMTPRLHMSVLNDTKS